jgi:hypothetical protein
LNYIEIEKILELNNFVEYLEIAILDFTLLLLVKLLLIISLLLFLIDLSKFIILAAIAKAIVIALRGDSVKMTLTLLWPLRA